MAIKKVPNLEGILFQKHNYSRNPERNVPKAIGFAGASIWLPRYIKLGCEKFIEEVEGQFVTGGQINFLATEEVNEITMVYIGNLARLANAKAAYWLADEVVRQKTSNLRDTAFLGIAKLVLEQDGMATDETRSGIAKALDAA